jgi:sortase (surface protein transpeptidase)
MVFIRRSAAITVAAGLLVIAAGTTGLLLTRHSTPGMRPPPLGVATVAAPTGPVVSLPEPSQSPSAPSGSPRSRPVQVQPAALVAVARPVSLTIPLIGVRTSLVTLGVDADGTLQVPSSTAVAGWYTGSARPGAIGPAIIVGHIDSIYGPGVFFRLSELVPGDNVYVTRADGTVAEFRVTSVQTYLKTYFPTQAVYGGTPDPELRLITCGGTFDDTTGHYLSNTIVFATEVN